MNKKLNLVSFVAGAVIGSAAAWFITKKKYEKITQEEIDSVKEVFNQKLIDAASKDCDKTEGDSTDAEEESEDAETYNEIIKRTGYANNNVKKDVDDVDTEVISPVDLGEIEDYDIVSLTYYADGTLADDNGNIIDVDKTVGAFALTQFGEYDDDAVHVRNYTNKTDYEVLLDERDYTEVWR